MAQSPQTPIVAYLCKSQAKVEKTKRTNKMRMKTGYDRRKIVGDKRFLTVGKYNKGKQQVKLGNSTVFEK